LAIAVQTNYFNIDAVSDFPVFAVWSVNITFKGSFLWLKILNEGVGGAGYSRVPSDLWPLISALLKLVLTPLIKPPSLEGWSHFRGLHPKPVLYSIAELLITEQWSPCQPLTDTFFIEEEVSHSIGGKLIMCG
jgi:hypothetical protein